MTTNREFKLNGRKKVEMWDLDQQKKLAKRRTRRFTEDATKQDIWEKLKEEEEDLQCNCEICENISENGYLDYDGL